MICLARKSKPPSLREKDGEDIHGGPLRPRLRDRTRTTGPMNSLWMRARPRPWTTAPAVPSGWRWPVAPTVHLVFTVLEEFNLRGAVVVAEALRPDIALQIDLMLASDTPDMADRGEMRLGGGPGLSHYSFHGRGTLNGVIPHPAVVRMIEAAAAAAGIPLQHSAQGGVLTDPSRRCGLVACRLRPVPGGTDRKWCGALARRLRRAQRHRSLHAAGGCRRPAADERGVVRRGHPRRGRG